MLAAKDSNASICAAADAEREREIEREAREEMEREKEREEREREEEKRRENMNGGIVIGGVVREESCQVMGRGRGEIDKKERRSRHLVRLASLHRELKDIRKRRAVLACKQRREATLQNEESALAFLIAVVRS